MCDTPIARTTSCVSSLRIYVGDSPYNYSVAIRVNRVILVSLCAETIKPVSEGHKIYTICLIYVLSGAARTWMAHRGSIQKGRQKKGNEYNKQNKN